MIRIKTLSLPVVSAFIAASAVPASAQLSLELSSQKTYRTEKKGIFFTGGRFDVRLQDGAVVTIGFCNDPQYYPPGTYINACSPGTSGYLSSGNLNGATVQRPYLVVTFLNGATVIQPREQNLISLISAPASKLPRPSGGFVDDSASVYYNLNTPNIREYFLTNYSNTRSYNKNQRGKFEAEIVTGVYRYSFPRLGRPDLPAPLTAVIYPMVEGISEKNNKTSGFTFSKVNNNKWNGNFMELSYRKPNRISWTGLTRDVIFVSVDDLYFSIRALDNPTKPKTSDLIRGNESIFPSFSNNAGEPRLLLRNPLVSNFTIPPVLPSGTKGMIEVEVQRNFQTGGATYDFSRRRFQVPVVVIDRFTEYKETALARYKKATILQDSDGDGVNNLNEWILDSNAGEATSVPTAPDPAAFLPEDINGTPTLFGNYFGFNIVMKKGTVPKVKYILQRSKDDGKTWETFNNGTDTRNWTVERVVLQDRGTLINEIRVRSLIAVPDEELGFPVRRFIQPPGTESHIYRTKIVLAKKKK